MTAKWIHFKSPGEKIFSGWVLILSNSKEFSGYTKNQARKNAYKAGFKSFTEVNK